MTKARRHNEGSGAWWWSVAKACRTVVSHVAEVDREDNGAGGVTVVSGGVELRFVEWMCGGAGEPLHREGERK
ncbi:hypothetical protein WN944_014738 [Citrus x changshan-huyou]|uniref:Uncharacterized protein n=1 Tax=Citrus x changshan-huyou TaxID=2935761 RepID=A0AAP0M685_9ROSI